MDNFETSLLRERFTIHDLDHAGKAKPIIAVSNRIICRFSTPSSDHEEFFVVRGHNMHSCIRMVARMFQSYKVGGFLVKRTKRYDWVDAWRPVLNDYERQFNPDHWIAIYHDGKPLFQQGERHSFIDVVEHCDFQNNGDYETSLSSAEEAFKKTGKNVRIEYDRNIAYTMSAEKDAVRNGIILREPGRNTTFNFNVSVIKGEKAINVPQCLSAAAAYLEALQLAFLLGTNTVKLEHDLIERQSIEHKQTREARARLARLNTEVSNLEMDYKVFYRPERPSFKLMISNAEALTRSLIADGKL